MKHIIFRVIDTREHYWTTCGWSPFMSAARKYATHGEAATAHRRMTKTGLRCMVGQPGKSR